MGRISSATAGQHRWAQDRKEPAHRPLTDRAVSTHPRAQRGLSKDIELSHNITTVEATADSVTRECECGWVTIGTIPEPDHHTPLAHREADHLAEMAKIEDGSIWNDIPAHHSYELFLRRRLADQTPNHVVVNAVWMGGSQAVLIWPWNAAGLADAQEWCDNHHVTWARSRLGGGHPVQPGSLAAHAGSI